MFVDSHAHLEMSQFDADRAATLQRARQAGVQHILAIGSGTGPGSLACAIHLAEQYEGLYATIGIHPHEAKLATDADFSELKQLARHPKVIAWGEIGLDYFYDHSPRPRQREVFLRQLELARSVQLPVVIHCRPSQDGEDAWRDCLELLRTHWAGSGLRGVLHCFTGTMEHARQALEMGFLVSFAGNITFAKAQGIRQVAAQLPLEHALIETDSPFLAPAPHRGKRNEPAFVVEVARHIGELRGLPAEEVGARTAQNFFDFFKLPSSNTTEGVQLGSV